MQGNNMLTLNEATMIAVVQEWLNFKLAAQVASIEAATENSCPVFKIHLKERIAADKK